MSAKEMKIQFIDVGINDNLPYSKADLVKISRISNNISLSFYQLDYQALAAHAKKNAMTLNSDQIPPPKDGSEYLIPVGKIVLDRNGFQQLLNEADQIKKAIADDK